LRFLKFLANFFGSSRIYFGAVNGNSLDDRSTPLSQDLRIMTLRRSIRECDQCDTGRSAISAEHLAALSVFLQPGRFIPGDGRNTGLRSEESPYPLRT
jgi:hypothetical protein